MNVLDNLDYKKVFDGFMILIENLVNTFSDFWDWFTSPVIYIEGTTAEDLAGLEWYMPTAWKYYIDLWFQEMGWAEAVQWTFTPINIFSTALVATLSYFLIKKFIK